MLYQERMSLINPKNFNVPLKIPARQSCPSSPVRFRPEDSQIISHLRRPCVIFDYSVDGRGAVTGLSYGRKWAMMQASVYIWFTSSTHDVINATTIPQLTVALQCKGNSPHTTTDTAGIPSTNIIQVLDSGKRFCVPFDKYE